MNYKTIGIVIAGLVIHWLFSHSFYGIKMKQIQLKDEFLKSLLIDSGMLSPNKRIFDFLFDLCLINFASKSELIFDIGLLQSIQANFHCIIYYLILFSPFKKTPMCPEFLKAIISLFIVAYPFVVIEIMGPKTRGEFSKSKYNILIIPIVIILNYLLFAIVDWVLSFIYSLIQINLVIYTIGVFILFMIFSLYVVIAMEIRDDMV